MKQEDNLIIRARETIRKQMFEITQHQGTIQELEKIVTRLQNDLEQERADRRNLEEVNKKLKHALSMTTKTLDKCVEEYQQAHSEDPTVKEYRPKIFHERTNQ